MQARPDGIDSTAGLSALASASAELCTAVGQLRDALEISAGSLELHGEAPYVLASLDDVSIELHGVEQRLRDLRVLGLLTSEGDPAARAPLN
ncbi:MAG TPA: hypothetical protein VMD59_16755 [Acidimicrobiales bacterium]|nr:hypothetical protein [Acidimicrobiales bacterium]